MARYIDTNYLFKCPTCRHFDGDECNTLCDSYECYSPNMLKIPTADVVEVKWISTKERLPDKEGKYLVYKESECFKSIGTAWFSLNLHELDEYDFPNKHRPGWNNYDSESGYYEECGVSHWMPLPEPPEN